MVVCVCVCVCVCVSMSWHLLVALAALFTAMSQCAGISRRSLLPSQTLSMSGMPETLVLASTPGSLQKEPGVETNLVHSIHSTVQPSERSIDDTRL